MIIQDNLEIMIESFKFIYNLKKEEKKLNKTHFCIHEIYITSTNFLSSKKCLHLRLNWQG